MIGGRSGWIAWPVGVLCVGVVAGLVWLAQPGVPGAVQLAGDLLREGSQSREAAASTPRPIESIGTALTDDCRSLYPDGLWSQLTWQPHIVLTQTQDAPDTSAVSVRDALQADVLMTCRWREPGGGTVSSTLARVDAEATLLAQPGFGSQGFNCAASGDGVRCTKTAGETTEIDIVRGGMWLSTIERSWHPERYSAQLVQRLWP
jgi:hypothetical protein